jgi:Icc-related predicted phosphoesterase
MRICVWSDLHLEFQDKVPDWKNPGADVLLLAGDICVADNLYGNPTAGLDGLIQNGFYANDAIRYRRFFDHVSKEFETVIYVIGNHEHYKGRWDRTESVLRNEFSRYENMHLLEQGKLVINDTVFLGASMWTSLNDGDPLTIFNAKDMMNDYKSITEKNGDKYHKLRPETTYAKHRETVRWLDHMLSDDKRPTVVVGHHAPSKRSIHEKYQSQTIMNGAFASSMEHLMLDRDHVKLWVHGHVHDRHDYMIGDTRILCNPRGYPGEASILNFDPTLLVRI